MFLYLYMFVCLLYSLWTGHCVLSLSLSVYSFTQIHTHSLFLSLSLSLSFSFSLSLSHFSSVCVCVCVRVRVFRLFFLSLSIIYQSISVPYYLSIYLSIIKFSINMSNPPPKKRKENKQIITISFFLFLVSWLLSANQSVHVRASKTLGLIFLLFSSHFICQTLVF